jgi:hypothetical protein
MRRSRAIMEARGSTRFSTAAFLLVLLCSLLQSPAALAGPVKLSYIVYLGGHPRRRPRAPPSRTTTSSEPSSESKLPLPPPRPSLASREEEVNVCTRCSREKAREAISYSYTTSINGFAANMEPAEAAEISSETPLHLLLLLLHPTFCFFLR